MVVFSCNPESVPLLPVFNLSGIGCPGLWLSRPPRIRSRVRALGERWDGSEVCVCDPCDLCVPVCPGCVPAPPVSFYRYGKNTPVISFIHTRKGDMGLQHGLRRLED